jgi:exonuclease V gamma subunit
MLYLNFAHSADLLLSPLVNTLRSIWKDPFQSPLFVVPNPATGKWLKLRLSEFFGCILNPEICTIEKILWKALQPDNTMIFLHKGNLQQIICALLDNELFEKDSFIQIRNYLKKDEIIDPVKRVQLSGEIARLLIEYEYNRPSVREPDQNRWRVKGVDLSWTIEDKLYFSEKSSANQPWIAESEIWQKEIYKKLFGNQGIFCFNNSPPNDQNSRYLTLPQLYRLREELSTSKGPLTFEGPPTILFLLSKISHFHRNMLLEMSQSRDIYVYLINPCSEFWEDVDTTRNKRGRRKWNYPKTDATPPISKLKSSEYDSNTLDFSVKSSDHHLLELWGNSGKENIALWCQAAQYNFEFLFPDQETQPQNRLQELQKALLTRNGSKMDEMKPDDQSIRILAAPEIGREVEMMRENLFNLLKKDSRLKLDDIVVYVTDPGKYRPYIDKVFGGYNRNEPGYIPYVMLGIDAGQSRFAFAIKDLIALCGGEFTRARVFSFLRNESVLSSRKINRYELDSWERRSAGLGTFRGFDSSHRIEMGDHEKCASDAHTFQLGIAQLLLGPLADKPVPLGFNLNSIDGAEPAPYRDFDTSDKDSLEHYCSTIEELAEMCRNFKNRCGNSSPSELVKLFLELTDKWVDVSDHADETYCRNEFRNGIEEVVLQESICGRNRLNFEEFKTFVLSSLQLELPGSSSTWTGCLTFTPLRTGFVLPHKVAFLLGMDADAFPGTSNSTMFNLLSNKRIIGDPDPVRDNRYIFLELICAVKDSLIISFLGQDIQRDRILQPSSVVLELASVARVHLPDPEKGPIDPGVIPLVSYEAIDDKRDIQFWDPDTSRLAVLTKELSVIKHIKYRLTISSDKKPDLNLKTSKPALSINDIKQFLENPLEYHLKKSLRLADEETDSSSIATDEPLESDYLSLYSIKKQLLTRLVQWAFPKTGESHFRTPDFIQKTAKLVKELYAEKCSKGITPEGDFAYKELILLDEWAHRTYASVAEIANRYQNYRSLIDTDLNLSKDNVLSDFLINREENSYRLKAQIPFVLVSDEPNAPIAVLKLGKDDANTIKNIDLWLSAFLFAFNGKDEIETIIINSEDGSADLSKWKRPEPWDRETAGSWLYELVQEILELNVCDHAPAVWFEDVYKKLIKYENFSIERFINRLRDKAEEETEGENQQHRLYRPRTDAFKLTEPHFRDSDEEIKKVFRRLSPILMGEFYREILDINGNHLTL